MIEFPLGVFVPIITKGLGIILHKISTVNSNTVFLLVFVVPRTIKGQ